MSLIYNDRLSQEGKDTTIHVIVLFMDSSFNIEYIIVKFLFKTKSVEQKPRKLKILRGLCS